MVYNKNQSPNGFYRASGEYLGYPIYRSHTSLSDVKKKQCISNNVPYYRTHQVHGGSGIRSSSSGKGDVMANSHGFNRDHTMRRSTNHNGWTNSALFNFNEKETMQSLNGRLASYLENVKKLEEENVMLEKKICEWYEKNTGKAHPDFGPYLHMISDLQHQVLQSKEHVAGLVKQIGESHMVADEFRKKQAMAFQMRTSIEMDLSDHLGILETINMEKHSLNVHTQCLEDELQQLKKTSEEEIRCLQTQLGTRVSVEVDAAPSMDLNKALADIRKEYESLMQRNLNEVESRFHEMTSEINNMMSSDIKQLQQFNNEAIDLKLQKKTLETELSKQLSMASVHNSTLMEINQDYGYQLKKLQDMINITEHQVEEIQSKMKQSNEEYTIYLNIKTYLEQEIATYKKLMERQIFEHAFCPIREESHHL